MNGPPTGAAIGVARWSALAARLVFATLVVTLPLRARVDVFPHPASAVSAVLNDLVVYAIDILALATLGLWLAARALDRRRIALGTRAMALPALVLLGLAWFTIPFGVEPALSVAGALRLTLGAALAVYVVNEVNGLDSIAVPVGAMLTIQSVVAIGQAATGNSVGLGAIGEVSLNPAVAGTSVVTLADGTRLLRAYGLSPHPNILGGFLACGSLLLLGATPSSRAARVVQRLIVVLAAVALLLSFSRGAWLGELAGLGLGLAMLAAAGLRGTTRRWLATAVIAAVAFAAAGWLARDAVASRVGLTRVAPATEQRSIDERLAQIRLGWRVVMERPLTGSGAGALPVAMRELEPGFTFAFYPPHLVALLVAGELGIAGGVAYLWLVSAPWVLLARMRWRWTVELAGVSAALAALLVASVFDEYPWVGGPGRMLAWLVLGLWSGTHARARRVGVRRDAA